MKLLPLTRPRIGLCIRAHSVSAVELGRDWRTGWRTHRVRRMAERPLPSGLLKPSSTELNVTDIGKLADEIEMLLDRSGPTAVALALPDACARTALFEFETLPAKPAECLALIRWRFQKELNVPAEAGRLAYRVFRHDRTTAAGPARVLATVVRRPIIEQYEQVCEKASVIPTRIGLSTLVTFDFCRPVMEQALADRVLHGRGADELFFALVAEDGFSLVAVRDGLPMFLRMKNRNGNGSAASLAPRASLADELAATLHFYDESTAAADDRRSDRHDRPLFLAGGAAQDLLDASTAKTLGVEVSTMTWQTLSIRQTDSAAVLQASSLGAAASVLA